MGDGMYEGYRSGLEAAEKAKKMSLFGTDLCFTCARIMRGQESLPYLQVTTDFDQKVFLQAELVVEDGRPVPIPERIRFCSYLCLARHEGAMHLISRMIDLLVEEKSSPAFQANVRKHLEQVLRMEKPNV